MSRLFSIRPAYCLFVTSLFVLGGCQTMQNAHQGAGQGGSTSNDVVVQSSEDLLDGEGRMVLVEDERSADPIQQHMMARKDVNPKKVNRKNKFSKTVEDYKKDEQNHVRTLHVDGDAEALADAAGVSTKGLKIDSDPIKKQADAKSYVERVLAKHKARQAGLDALGEDDTAVPEKKVEPKKKDAAVKVASKAVEKGAGSGAIRVSDVRIGQHPGKTRIVMDVSDKARFQTSFEDGNKTLVVKMPDAAWDAEAEAKVVGQSLVQGYDTKKSGFGSVIKIALGAPGKIAYQKAFKPSGTRGHRIVLDVVAR